MNISTLHISLPIGAFDQVCSHHYFYHLLVMFVLLYGLVDSFLHFLSHLFVLKRPLAIEKDFDQIPLKEQSVSFHVPLQHTSVTSSTKSLSMNLCLNTWVHVLLYSRHYVAYLFTQTHSGQKTAHY